MLNKNNIDELVAHFRSLLPEDLRQTRDEIEKNVTAALNATLSRMNLVTREEYEIQRELLFKTRTLVDELEKRISELEKKLSTNTQE
jgi:BMFP domain-containing protein YqiC